MAQQTETVGGAAQDHDRHPCKDHHQRYRDDIDAEQNDLDEFHGFSPMSKYSGCLVSTSETTRMLPRPRKAAVSAVPRPASPPSRRFRRAIAMALLPSATAASASSRSGPRPKRRAIGRSRIISVPSDSTANTWARCSGVASAGIARRRRSRKVSASNRRVRNAGDSGGIRQNESAAAPAPPTIAIAVL